MQYLNKRGLALVAALAVTFVASAVFARPVVTSPIAHYDSFVRLPIPGGVSVEAEPNDRFASRQVVKFSRALTKTERGAINAVAVQTRHIRNLRWSDKQTLEAQFSSSRSAIERISNSMWAMVVHRGDRLPLGFILGADACAASFSGVQHPTVRSFADTLCRGEPAQLPTGLQNELSPADEYVLDLLRVQQRSRFAVEGRRFKKWVWGQNDIGPDQRALGMLQLAAIHVTSGNDIWALETLREFPKIEHVSENLQAVAVEMARGAFERMVETTVYSGQDITTLYVRFSTLDSSGLDYNVRMAIASEFERKFDLRRAIGQYQKLMKYGWDKDPVVLSRLAAAFEKGGETYRAKATIAYLDEIVRKKR